MDKPNGKKSKTSTSPKLISYYVNNIEFNTTSTKPISHYVKHDDLNLPSSKPISHYIKVDNLLSNSSSMLISKYLKINDSKENDVDKLNVDNEVKRARVKRNYISEFFKDETPEDSTQTVVPKNQIMCQSNLNYMNISQILKLKVVEDPVQEPSTSPDQTDKSKQKSVLISDYIKNTQPMTDNSIYLGKSELISNLFRTNEQEEVKEEVENKNNETFEATRRRSRNSNYISHYLKSKDCDDSSSNVVESEKQETPIPVIPTFKRSKLISQYIREKSSQQDQVETIQKLFKIKKSKEQFRPIKPRIVNKTNYISHVIKQNEQSNENMLRSSPETLNQIIRRNLNGSKNNTRKNVKRMKHHQRDKFIKKFIKLDNLVSRLRKTKKLD